MKKSSQFRPPFRIPSVFKKRESIVSLLIFLGLFIILPLLISGVYYQLDDRSRASLDDVITPPNVITPPQDCEGDNCQPVLDVLSRQEVFVEVVADQTMAVVFSGVENFAGVSQYQVAIDDGEFSEPRNFDPLYLDTSDPLSYKYAVAFPLSTFTDGRHVLKFLFLQGEGLPTSEIITYMFTSHIIPDDCREQRFDWDVDGWVTVLDHGRFLDRWKQFDETTLVGDFNCDQQVNVLDYGAFLSAWKEQLY